MDRNAESDGRRTFKRAYYSTVALLVVALVCLPMLVPLSFLLLGFDPSIRNADAPESFGAYRATAPFRQAFAFGVLLLATGVIALSVGALVLRARRRTDVPPAIIALAAVVATVAAAVVLASRLTPEGVCC